MRPESVRVPRLCLALVLMAMLPLTPAWASQPAATPSDSPDTIAHVRLEIRTAEGRHWFNVRVADTEALQEKGLMFVRSLPPDTGMLFPQRAPRIMTMWMKNTLIPLDMLFIDDTGKIICLRENAVPESLAIIGCERPVMAVLEIAGGQSARRHIAVGDTVVQGAPAPARKPARK